MQVMYDRSTQFWTLLFNILKKLPVDGQAPGTRGTRRDMKKSLFWAAHQRFYRQMLIASKVCAATLHVKSSLMVERVNNPRINSENPYLNDQTYCTTRDDVYSYSDRRVLKDHGLFFLKTLRN